MAKAKAKAADKKYRVGFIGCGGIAGRHFNDLGNEPRAEIVALCDPDPDRIKAWKERRPDMANATEYDDYKRMLKKEQLDIVYINSPHNVHYEQITNSMKAGCNVIAEKPMVCSIAHARKVCKMSEDLGKAVIAAYQRRYQSGYRKVREIVDSGELGHLLAVTAFQLQNWLRAVKGTWRQKKDFSCGGQLNDSGSHMIDILLFMINDVPKEVFCFLDNRETEVDIDSAVCARFRKGTLLSVLIGGSAAHWREEITFIFEKGSIAVHGDKLLLQRGDGQPVEEIKPEPFHNNPTKNMLDHLQTGAEILVGPEAGLRVMQLTEPAWKAAETGLPQKVRM